MLHIPADTVYLPAYTVINYEMMQGASFRRRIRVLGDDGVPLNLTGITAKAQLRRAPWATTIIHTMESASGTITFDTDRASGNIYLNISATATYRFDFHTCVWDLTFDYANNGGVWRAAGGRIKLIPAVTR